jgi:hypothetical protein
VNQLPGLPSTRAEVPETIDINLSKIQVATREETQLHSVMFGTLMSATKHVTPTNHTHKQLHTYLSNQ